MSHFEKYRLIGPMKLDQTRRDKAIWSAKGCAYSELSEFEIDIAEKYDASDRIDPVKLVDDFYKYWKNALKLKRCHDDGPSVPEGWCFFEPMDRNLPLIKAAKWCRVLDALNVQLWVWEDISRYAWKLSEIREHRDRDEPKCVAQIREPQIIWHRYVLR